MNTNNNFLERCVPVYIMGENGPLSKTPYGYFKGQSKLQGNVQVGQPLILGGLKGKVKVQALRFAKRRNDGTMDEFWGIGVPDNRKVRIRSCFGFHQIEDAEIVS